jgi:protein involved in polysaccharide export with SLBB domain
MPDHHNNFAELAENRSDAYHWKDRQPSPGIRFARSPQRLVAAVATVFSCVCLAASDDANAPGPVTKSGVIGVEDTVSISVLNGEEISKSWRVGSTGELSLPMAGTIHAAGLTIEELQQELVRRLKRYIIEPEVSVSVSEFRSQPITVTGAVAKPGVYQVDRHKTIFDVLVMAGGLANAGTRITLKRETARGSLGIPGARLGQDGYAVADMDLNEVMKRGAAAQLEMQANDQISVWAAGDRNSDGAPSGALTRDEVAAVSPLRNSMGEAPVVQVQGLNQTSPNHTSTATMDPGKFVYILGEVLRPGSVELGPQESISLMKVLAKAGGPGPHANGRRTVVTHFSAAGIQTSSSTIDVTRLQAGKAKDLELFAGDVVVVPSNFR